MPEAPHRAALGAFQTAHGVTRLVAPQSEPSDTDVNPLVAARAHRRRLHGQEPLDVTRHQ